MTAATGSGRDSLVTAWVGVLHEVVFGERPSAVSSGEVVSSPLDVQLVLVAPGGASALATVHWHGRSEPPERAEFAEASQAALTELLGIGVRCLGTCGPLDGEPGAWSDGASGSVGLVAESSWLASMPIPPAAPGDGIVVDVVLEGWPGSGGGTLVMEAESALQVRCGAREFSAVGTVDAAAFVLRESGCASTRGALARFDGSVLEVHRGAWSVEVAGQGSLVVDGRERGTARWVTDGARFAVRVDPAPVSEDDVETVVIERGALRDVLRGGERVAIDEPR